MIRIDEIYQSVFWAYLQQLPKSTRMFYFEPFGRTDPDSICCNFSQQNDEHKYIVFFDQEPMDLSRHQMTFEEIFTRCRNLYPDWPLRFPSSIDTNPILVTSEYYNPCTKLMCEKYGFLHLHYFFHGWAALDWFRGYNHSFLIKPAFQRKPTKTFLMPNRIIGGQRLHRVEMMYHIIKNDMLDNYISFPKLCPVEKIPVEQISADLKNVYPDIKQVFQRTQLPLEFRGESGHPMHSYQLSLFSECADSLLYLVSETVATGTRIHLTEKSLKPICLQMPFILIAGAGSLEYMRSYGFKTFSDFWDESYDHEVDDHLRLEKIAQVLKGLHNLGTRERQSMYSSMQSVIMHNFNHFYHGGFEQALWNELQGVLSVF